MLETRGLVIGKFCPPHAGHLFLMATAQQHCDRLSIILCENPADPIAAGLRAQWLRELVPAAELLVAPDIGRHADSAAWAAYSLEILGFAPDVVFTSEDYGEAYARLMGCRHMLVDRERLAHPVAASQVLQAPLAHWAQLSPPIRAYFAARVCLVGAESSGKSSLAEALARRYESVWVPEYGRWYYEGRMHALGQDNWEDGELELIARQQNLLEDSLARHANRLMFCDTNAFTTAVWQLRLLGHISPAVEAQCRGRSYAQWLLTDIDFPFVQDGTRETLQAREQMQALIRRELDRLGQEYVVVSGSPEARLEQCTALCAALLWQGGCAADS